MAPATRQTTRQSHSGRMAASTSSSLIQALCQEIPNQHGTGVVEHLLLIAVVVVPFAFLITHLADAIGYYFSFTCWVVMLPFS